MSASLARNVLPPMEKAAITLPPYMTAGAIIGPKGKVLQKLRQQSNTQMFYDEQHHKINVVGERHRIEAAASIVDKVVRNFVLAGGNAPEGRRVFMLSEAMSQAELLELVPVPGTAARTQSYMLAPVQESTSSSSSAEHHANEAVSSDWLLPTQQDWAAQDAVDNAISLALDRPAQFSAVSIKFGLGKCGIHSLANPQQFLKRDDLFQWKVHQDYRPAFNNSMSQQAVTALDLQLRSGGFTAVKQDRTVNLHLSCPGIKYLQYNPAYEVMPDNTLRPLRVETATCRVLAVSFVNTPNLIDYRMRLEGAAVHPNNDPVVLNLLQQTDQFSWQGKSQVVLPPNFEEELDLLVNIWRTKLRRHYEAMVQPHPDLPPVSMKVVVAAVMQRGGSKRYEVSITCKELDKLLLDLHVRKEEAPGDRQQLLQLIQVTQQFVQTLTQTLPC